jgi:hypothetical protein
MSTLQFPSRQKNLIALTIISGLILLVCSVLNLLPKSKLDVCIITYSFGVPLALLAFDTIIDLNNQAVLRTWFFIGAALALISIWATRFDKFKVARTTPSDQISGINSFIIDYSTSSLKSLFIFLIAYWLINTWLKRVRGVYVVNTFKQTKWYHDEAHRKTTWLDVLINLSLMLIIFAASLFGQ